MGRDGVWEPVVVGGVCGRHRGRRRRLCKLVLSLARRTGGRSRESATKLTRFNFTVIVVVCYGRRRRSPNARFYANRVLARPEETSRTRRTTTASRAVRESFPGFTPNIVYEPTSPCHKTRETRPRDRCARRLARRIAPGHEPVAPVFVSGPETGGIVFALKIPGENRFAYHPGAVASRKVTFFDKLFKKKKC